jgi:ATP-dependent helicase/nuclease subunit A
MHTRLADQHVRQTALDPQQSFIIQAPAGSGKTELLIRRFLSLLAHVSQPEEVLCLTFTRKAANEMRARVITALQSATQAAPEECSAAERWQLAHQALVQCERLNWDLLENPNRLRIGTIDAWCHHLVGRMPLLAKCGTQPEISDDPYPYYAQAAENCLANVYADSRWRPALLTLLEHLDNQHEAARALLIGMITKREQWLELILQLGQQDSRAHCEAALQRIVLQTLNRVAAQFPPHLKASLGQCCQFAAQYVEIPSMNLLFWQDAEFPSETLGDLPKWLGITELVFTKQDQWRKQVNKSIGFPAPSAAKNATDKQCFTEHKKCCAELLAELTTYPELKQLLIHLKYAPPLQYEDEQWQVTTALVQLLPLLVAELQLVFTQQQRVDFNEIALRAQQALGQLDAPSDLALHLDQQLVHILVDEFQDTSQNQLALLAQLTQDWQTGDGRSLFLVGDPMQSIYRFRQAEVGLFLQVQQQGLGDIHLQALALETNFRAQANLVEWTNQHFSALFPTQADQQLGAVPYSAAQPHHPEQADAVLYHRCQDNRGEAERVCQLVAQTLTEKPQHSIGILVRARSHLSDIITALKQAKISYQAVELETLAGQSVIQDLWALTRACHRLTDRVAWLALLRAPWCGLTLASIYQLCHADHDTCVWQQCLDYQHGLADDEQQRLMAFCEVMQHCLDLKQHSPLRQWVQTTWQQLSAPSYLTALEMQHAETYFSLLEKFDDGGLLTDFEEFERRLNNCYASPPASTTAVQVMTIHKAKGLEFDTVILPGLARIIRPDALRLCYWHSNPAEQELILAPLHAKHGPADAIYTFLRLIDQQKSQYEQVRLLYVAVTRAKQQLHLCYSLDTDAKTLNPHKNSSLAVLWPQLQQHLCTPAVFATQTTATPTASNTLKRCSEMPKNTLQKKQLDAPEPWSDPIPSLIGDFCHRIFRQIALAGLSQWHPQQLTQFQSAWKHSLLTAGLPPHQLSAALTQINLAIENILTDPMGRFFLAPHPQAQCEYALQTWQDGYLTTHILDRTFIDEKQQRWIIDYKVSQNNVLLPSYEQQLQRYAKLMARLDTRPIKLALYFALQPKTFTWDYEPEAATTNSIVSEANTA